MFIPTNEQGAIVVFAQQCIGTGGASMSEEKPCPLCGHAMAWMECEACDGNGSEIVRIERMIGDGGNEHYNGPTCNVCDGEGGWWVCRVAGEQEANALRTNE